jgi:thiamine-phosphate pyrophosphorylase
MPDVLRILDANANRAREAARLMEEAARFLLDDPALAEELKNLRHELAAALATQEGVELHRDTPGDVGTGISTPAEGTRRSAAEVVVAAGKRLSESLRCLEEYGKLTDPGFSASIEKLRYQGYDLETRLHRRLGSAAARQWRLCVILTETLCTHRHWAEIAEAAVVAGADCLQLREKQLPHGELLRRARRLVEIAGARAAVIVNDRPDVALIAGAAGVHLGADDLPVASVRRLAGRRLIIGASTHDLSEADRAVAAGADDGGGGPLFATKTKERVTSGPEYLQQFIERYPEVPHLAIGGIIPANVDQVVDAGAQGVAVSSAVCGAEDPEQAVRDLLGAWE